MLPGPCAPVSHYITHLRLLWDAVLPALVAADPMFQGEERALCAAYGGNGYAPKLGPH